MLHSVCSTEETGTARSDIYITSKLKHNKNYDSALADLRTSLKKTGVEYFDLYLMHSAIGGAKVRKEVWRALVAAQKQGLVKSIGVCFNHHSVNEVTDA